MNHTEKPIKQHNKQGLIKNQFPPSFLGFIYISLPFNQNILNLFFQGDQSFSLNMPHKGNNQKKKKSLDIILTSGKPRYYIIYHQKWLSHLLLMHPQQHLIFQEFTESLPGHFPVGPMQGGCSMVTQNEVGGRECMQRWGAERALPYSCVTVPGPGHKHLLLMCITSISDKLGTALPSPPPTGASSPLVLPHIPLCTALRASPWPATMRCPDIVSTLSSRALQKTALLQQT